MPDHKAKLSGVAWKRENGKKIILLKLSVESIIERTFRNGARILG